MLLGIHTLVVLSTCLPQHERCNLLIYLNCLFNSYLRKCYFPIRFGAPTDINSNSVSVVKFPWIIRRRVTGRSNSWEYKLSGRLCSTHCFVANVLLKIPLSLTLTCFESIKRGRDCSHAGLVPTVFPRLLPVQVQRNMIASSSISDERMGAKKKRGAVQKKEEYREYLLIQRHWYNWDLILFLEAGCIYIIDVGETKIKTMLHRG